MKIIIHVPLSKDVVEITNRLKEICIKHDLESEVIK
jgi:hypothetical protein